MTEKNNNIHETNIFEMLGRIHADIATLQNDSQWIKESLKDTKKVLEEKGKADKEKFASKYIERIVWIMMVGLMGWALNQLLALIPTVQAIFN